MREAVVAITGATVILACVLALVEFDHRAGPYDLALGAAEVEVQANGTYHATPESTTAGLCLVPPCTASTTIELRLSGLPAAPYEARLEGSSTVHLGQLQQDGEDHLLRWSEAEDHTDKQRLVLVLAGRPIAPVMVGPTPEPMSLDGTVLASWLAPMGEVHLNEIGGFEISTVVKAELDHAPPDGWSYVAWLEGADGRIDLGPLAMGPPGSVLDARVENVPLERQDTVVIGLLSDGGGAAFPFLQATV